MVSEMEMVEPYTSADFCALSYIKHGFFGSHGGVSKGIYTSLNCGYGSDDSKDDVSKNRAQAMQFFGKRETGLCTLYQMHSSKVISIKRVWSPNVFHQADALVTDVPGIVLGILTADCTPVLFADTERGIIGAAHAGWKGAYKGILQNTTDAMRKLGAENIIACIGPCLAQKSYEVGEEFLQYFLKQSSQNQEFFARGISEGKYLFDLTGYVKRNLREAGVANISALDIDTYENDFFSYRRTCHLGERDYGRQLSAIMIHGEGEVEI